MYSSCRKLSLCTFNIVSYKCVLLYFHANFVMDARMHCVHYLCTYITYPSRSSKSGTSQQSCKPLLSSLTWLSPTVARAEPPIFDFVVNCEKSPPLSLFLTRKNSACYHHHHHPHIFLHGFFFSADVALFTLLHFHWK